LWWYKTDSKSFDFNIRRAPRGPLGGSNVQMRLKSGEKTGKLSKDFGNKFNQAVEPKDKNWKFTNSRLQFKKQVQCFEAWGPLGAPSSSYVNLKSANMGKISADLVMTIKI
jgi:hypothetical protein